jgi:hypothetical protein
MLHAIVNSDLEEWGFTLRAGFDVSIPVVLDKRQIQQFDSDVLTVMQLVQRMQSASQIPTHERASNYTLGAESFRNLRAGGFVARPDFIFHQGNLKIVELNIDSSVGGIAQVGKFASLFASHYSLRDNISFRSPVNLLSEYISSFVVPEAPTVAVISSSYFSDYNKKIASALADALQCDQFRCIACFPEEVVLDASGDYLKLDGVALSAAYRLDAIDGGSAASLSLRAFLEMSTRSATAIISDSLLMQIEHKSSLANLIEACANQSPIMSPTERSLVMRMIPDTRRLDGEICLRERDLREYLVLKKNGTVLKRVYSFGGSHVRVGPFCSNEVWGSAIDTALASPSDWLMQEYVEPDRVVRQGKWFRIRPGGVGQRCVLSPFVFGDTIGGFLCRTQVSEAEGCLGLVSGAAMGFFMVGEE